MLNRQILTGLVCLILNIGITAELRAEVSSNESAFSKEVRDVLENKITLLKKEIVNNEKIIREIIDSNAKYMTITQSEILSLDKEWMQVQGLNDFMEELMQNDAAIVLLDFRDEYDGFAEIFITNLKGLNAAMTNKTSDYFQADEAWWQRCYNKGKGLAYYGEIEFDESAVSEAISIYIPIKNYETNNVIGVMKAVLDLTAIKMEL